MTPSRCDFGMARGQSGRCVAFAGALPAAARDFVQDQAGMFSPATVAQLNARIANFNAQTGKEIVVVTTPSLGGATLQDAAQHGLLAAKRQRRPDLRRARRSARHHRPRPRGRASRLVHARRAALDPQRDGELSFAARTTMPASRAQSTRFSTSIARILAACSSARRRISGAASAGGARHTFQRSTHFDVLVDHHCGRRFLILRSILRALLDAAQLWRRTRSATRRPPPGGPGLWTRLRPGLRIRRRRQLLERIARRTRRRVARQRALSRRRWHRAAQAGQTSGRHRRRVGRGEFGRMAERCRARPIWAAQAAATGAAAASAMPAAEVTSAAEAVTAAADGRRASYPVTNSRRHATPAYFFVDLRSRYAGATATRLLHRESVLRTSPRFTGD